MLQSNKDLYTMLHPGSLINPLKVKQTASPVYAEEADQIAPGILDDLKELEEDYRRVFEEEETPLPQQAEPSFQAYPNYQETLKKEWRELRKSPEMVRLAMRRTWHWRVRGYDLAGVRNKLMEEGFPEIPQQTLVRFLRAVTNAIAKEFRDEILQAKLRQQALLDEIIVEALSAWEQSKQPRTETTVITGKVVPVRRHDPETGREFFDFLPLPNQTQVKTYLAPGNPAYLKTVMDAMDAQRVLWGLEAPKKVDVTSNGQSIIAYNITPPSDAPPIEAEFRVDEGDAAVVGGVNLHEAHAQQVLPPGHPDAQHPDRSGW